MTEERDLTGLSDADLKGVKTSAVEARERLLWERRRMGTLEYAETLAQCDADLAAISAEEQRRGAAVPTTVSIRLENVHTDQIRQLGPFEFVQLTYGALRVGPDGDEVAVIQHGDWLYLEDDTTWTDVIIAPTGS